MWWTDLICFIVLCHRNWAKYGSFYWANIWQYLKWLLAVLPGKCDRPLMNKGQRFCYSLIIQTGSCQHIYKTLNASLRNPVQIERTLLLSWRCSMVITNLLGIFSGFLACFLLFKLHQTLLIREVSLCSEQRLTQIFQLAKVWRNAMEYSATNGTSAWCPKSHSQTQGPS